MKIKDGVIMAGLKMEMRMALGAADEIWRKHGQELVVTSALDGEHVATSLHYYGYALDFRTRYFDEETKFKVYYELMNAVSSAHYRVLFYKTHIHIEWRGHN